MPPAREVARGAPSAQIEVMDQAVMAPIESIVDDLADEFELLGDWEQRYRHIIDLGRNLESLSEAEHSDFHKVRGCASQVWLIAERDGAGRIRFRGDSDAHIVRGLIAVLLSLFNGRTGDEILGFDARAAFDRLGLAGALSRQRSNGLFSMVERIRQEAGT